MSCTKHTLKQALKQAEVDLTDHRIDLISLRYFNAAGADAKLRVGEWHEPETHLIPRLLAQANDTNASPFQLFGDDYPTPDGTYVRNYIHLSDLATAHFLAIDSMKENPRADV